MANQLPTRQVALLAAAGLISVQLATAQGVAVTGRTARQSSLAKTDLPPPKIQFEDVAKQAGLRFQHVLGQPRDKAYILETTGSGVAIFDFDNDGLPDIFFVNGRTWTEDDGEDKPGPTSRLFRNLGDLRFKDVTEPSGLIHTGWGQGVCVGRLSLKRGSNPSSRR